MRLWSLNPKYLDRQGLLALWRESLLAKKVLEGKTKGYKNHPQLNRFKESDEALKYINSYLSGIFLEAEARGYKFDRTKIENEGALNEVISVNRKQVDYEWNHLLNKLKVRDNIRYLKFKDNKSPQVHFLFYVVPGEIEKWEIIK